MFCEVTGCADLDTYFVLCDVNLTIYDFFRLISIKRKWETDRTGTVIGSARASVWSFLYHFKICDVTENALASRETELTG